MIGWLASKDDSDIEQYDMIVIGLAGQLKPQVIQCIDSLADVFIFVCPGDKFVVLLGGQVVAGDLEQVGLLGVLVQVGLVVVMVEQGQLLGGGAEQLLCVQDALPQGHQLLVLELVLLDEGGALLQLHDDVLSMLLLVGLWDAIITAVSTQWLIMLFLLHLYVCAWVCVSLWVCSIEFVIQ